MKKKLVLVVGCSFLTHLSIAQTGDFDLPGSQGRKYVTIAADSGLVGDGMKRFLVGRNYRSEWTTPIRVPVLKLETDLGGLTPEKEGGGKQTHTLHLDGADGRKWSLRSVQKFPEKVLDRELKGTAAQTIVVDGISASYPYGVLSVGTLAKAAGVPFLPNTVVYIPDDPALGKFRSKYKNTLALLELRGVEDKTAKEYDTEDIVMDLFKNNKKTVDQQATLRARLLDNFIMDFDRHEGQWSWKEKDSAGRKFYRPIPKDRDQAFFKGDGFLIKKLSKIPRFGQLQGLRAEPKNALSFNWGARNFDRSFLNELDEKTWSNEIDSFLSSVGDGVIGDALQRQPAEIHKYHVDEITDVLKKKKQYFKDDMMKYYRFLSKTVSVLGTNDADRISISENTDGSIALMIEDLKDSTITYQRVFDPAVTRELRIYGLEGADQLVVKGHGSPIKLRLIGGPGEDVFTNSEEGGKAKVYDVSFENNTVTGKGLKKKISSDPLNNEYQRINEYYNSSSVGLKPEYARDGGLFLGLRYSATVTQGFRKEPYASKHLVYLTKAFSNSGWHAHYEAEFISIAKKTDLVFSGDGQLPTVRTNFFGYGNNTELPKYINREFYRIHYTIIEASLMARHRLAPWLQLSWGPVTQYFKILKEKNEHLYAGSLPSPINDNMYLGKWYTGGEVRAIVNTRNSDLMPTRGIYFNTYARGWLGLSNQTNNYSQVGAEFNFYSDFLYKDHIVLAGSFGAHRNFDRFEIPQAEYLGLRQNLRGYRFQRFAGKARAYNNTELRVNFGDVNLHLFKGPVGVLAFHDVGRVWVSHEDSEKWHTGYGGGVWVAPFGKLVLTGMLSFSKEENVLPIVIFGFTF
ncbi:MAG: BamA/TamA family outer membrane protein [Flavisolibacter sp.]